MEGVADRLIERFDLRDKQILEIGCGVAWFLEMLCVRGGNHGIGVDPTATWEGQKSLPSGSIEVIRRAFGYSFTDEFPQIAPEFVCCLSVFEHIPEPTGLLSALRRMLARSAATLGIESRRTSSSTIRCWFAST
jgi:2-polyprenyl-3-methyl-5-hydroxy-6-metoxy-1,4-benzoquinol methylase